MATIRKKVRLLAFVAGIGAAVSICLFIISISELYFEAYTWTLLYVSIPMTLISIIVLIREYKRLKIAEVIIENQILHIRSAYSLIADSGETTSSYPERMDIFISNFGILLDAKIIKFNQGGIQLKAVEIGRDFISLTYGTDKRMQKTWLLRMHMDDRELADVVEKFRYETGVVPVINDC
ncbi:MAG: hypothetical protein AB1420_12675 [Bacillota bacterium]